MTAWTAPRQTSLSFTISKSLLKFMSIEPMMPSNHLTLCHPLLLKPSIFPSVRVFSNKSALCIRWPQYWSFSFSPSNEYPGLISVRIYWFDLLTVHHHSLRASSLGCSTFFIVSHPYMTTGKTIALTIQTFVSKVIYQLFNMLSRFVMALLGILSHLVPLSCLEFSFKSLCLSHILWH